MDTPIRTKLYGQKDVYVNTPTLEFDDNGWGSDVGVFRLVIESVRPKTIIEVGTWKGKSARHMAGLCKNKGLGTEIICVDTWLGSQEHWDFGNPDKLFDIFRSNTIKAGHQDCITPIRLDSINAFYVLQKLGVVADMIYIDAQHDYEAVKLDLQMWSKILRVGGILVGDDAHHFPVHQAFTELFGNAIEHYDGKYVVKRSQ